MEITSSNRDSLFVPSIKCQSLLGKAIQEHFTKPSQIASVFSSSPSLRNSSAGANFLTNFEIDGDFVKIYETVFTPEDCFSIQLAFAVRLNPVGRSWNRIFGFLSKLATTKYFSLSLRSLQIGDDRYALLMSDRELCFIATHLKRITSLHVVSSCNISEESIRVIGENLDELEELNLSGAAQGINGDAVAHLTSKMTRLTSLNLSSTSVSVEALSELSALVALETLLLNASVKRFC
jgi:hypothetical protein